MCLKFAKKYRNILTGKQKIPPEDEDIKTDEEKKARAANERAYSGLILSCNDEVSFGIVEAAVTKELPNGSATKAWEDLNSKYDPKTGTNKTQLQKEFARSKMKHG